MTTLGLVGALALILANAFFVAVEFALVAVDRTEMELAASAGDRRARLIVGGLDRLSFHLSGVQLGITVSSVVLGFVAEPAVASLLRGPTRMLVGAQHARAVSLVVALALATVVQMVIGELIPKALAVARPAATARALATAMTWYMRIFAPVIRLFGGAADGVVRLFGMEPREELNTVRSRPELMQLVRASANDGTLDRTEAALLQRSFRFGEKVAADALTPRTDLVSIDVDAVGSELLERSLRTGLSRFPVTSGDVDHIVGVVHVKALLSLPYAERDSVGVRELMAEPFVVPEQRDLARLLLEMREQRIHLAVVLDEYGGTAGIITLEDLLEEIVGEIDDEHDPGRRIARPLGRTLLIPGGLHRDEVEEVTGFRVPDGDFETIAGFLLDRFGRIPRPGESVQTNGWTFTVMAMDRHRIDLVQVRRPQRRDSDDRPSHDEARRR